jgi:sugar phosphate permease
MIGWFMVAIPLSLALTGPVSNLVMQALAGVFGLKDWQWLFIAEAIPTVLLSLVVLILLPDKPKDAKWLTPEERDWLQGTIDSEQRQIESNHSAMKLLTALTDGRTLAFSATRA